MIVQKMLAVEGILDAAHKLEIDLGHLLEEVGTLGDADAMLAGGQPSQVIRLAVKPRE